MHRAKWEKLVDQIERQFGFIEHTTEEFPERRLTVETVVFDGASGRMMLERSEKPVVIDKKTSFSKRVGSEVSIEYVYSEDEVIDTVKLFRWDGLAREWKQLDISALGR
jgi:hypothetical protein